MNRPIAMTDICGVLWWLIHRTAFFVDFMHGLHVWIVVAYSKEGLALDLRIVKTKKAIRKAFFELLRTKDINSITIKEIAELAEIDRKTFYSHYDAIYDLVDELEDEAVLLVAELVYDMDAYAIFSNPDQMRYVLETITENKAFSYLRYLFIKGNADLLTKFTTSVKSRMIAEIKPRLSLDDTTLSLVVDYTIAGITTCYQSWLKDGRPISIQELCEQLSRIIVLGLRGIGLQGSEM